MIHLSEETEEKIGEYLKRGETYITERELWKRQSDKASNKRFNIYLDELTDTVKKRKEDVKQQ